MADFPTGLTNQQTVNSLQVGNKVITLAPSGSDDTAAIQAALDSLPIFTHGALWYDTLVSGGGELLLKGRYLTNDTIYIPEGVIIRGVSIGTGIYFTPSVAGTAMFKSKLAETAEVSSWIGLRNLHFTSNIAYSPFDENVGVSFVDVQRWFIENCRFEGFGVALSSSGVSSYYNLLSHTEFFNNILSLELKNLAQPTTMLGGALFTNTFFNGKASQPTALVYTEGSVNFFGVSFEPAGEVADGFVCIKTGPRLDGRYRASVIIEGGYTESGYPLLEVDKLNEYENHHVNLNHYLTGAFVKFKNFDSRGSFQYPTGKKGALRTSLSGGKLVPLVTNPGLKVDSTDWELVQDGVWDTTQSFLQSAGVIKVSPSVTDNTTYIRQHFTTTADLHVYEGQIIYYGVLLKLTDITSVTVQVQDDPYVLYMTSADPTIDYGNGWGLYVLNFPMPVDTVMDNMVGTYLLVKAVAANTTTSEILMAGAYSWINGIDEIPIYRTDELP